MNDLDLCIEVVSTIAPYSPLDISDCYRYRLGSKAQSVENGHRRSSQWEYWDVWSLIGHRSSEGVWRCLVNGLTQYRSSERGTKTFVHWLDTADRQRRVLRRLVTGWTKKIVRERVLRCSVTGLTQQIVKQECRGVWLLVRHSRSSERGF